MTAISVEKKDKFGRDDDSLTLAADAINKCDVLIITAGAGMSVDGGIPDLVDIDKAFPELKNLSLGVRDISNAELFLEKPRFAWGIFSKRMQDYRQASPHDGYGILLEWCSRKTEYWIYTSNIDKHFTRAGFLEDRVVECNGSIFEFQCAIPCCDDVWGSDGIVIEYDENTLMAGDEVPRCRHCDSVARPCTTLASDSRWLGRGARIREQSMEDRLAGIPTVSVVVILEIGCGVQMLKVRNKSEDMVKRFRARGHHTVFVRLNCRCDHLRMPNPSQPEDISLCTTALLGLLALDQRIQTL